MAERGRTYHHGDLRAALLVEAASMIREGGVASVTMRELGRRLGVSRSAPYRHFPDKGALLVAVAAAGFERLRERMEATNGDGPSKSVAAFQRMGEEYVRFALENPAHYRLMYGKEALARGVEPELREAANGLYDQLVEVIETHQRAGTIERQDPRTQAYVAWGAMHGLASLLIEGQILTPVDVDRLVRRATRTLLDGMRAREATTGKD